MSHAPTEALLARHALTRQALAERQLGALVVTSLPNILYLTNFTGTAAIVVLTLEKLWFITDFRYRTSVESARATPWECPDLDLMLSEGSYDGTLARLLQGLAVERVGFEAAHVSVSRYEWLKSALSREGGPAKELVPTEGVVESRRAVKDQYEIATLREAARYLSRVARDAIVDVAAGRSERELAMTIDWRMRDAGFTKPAFDTIVASGPNAALPHARPGERILAEGDLVVLDFGGVYDSYCVDLTRTISIGPADERRKTVYSAVLAAHDLAVRAVRPGVSRFAIDRAARDELSRRGFGEAFGHGTGHGLGIEVHEDPRIGKPRADETEDPVVAGMVFTIEPGVYLPGWGGVRIEDDVVVTEGGVEVLTAGATSELIEV